MSTFNTKNCQSKNNNTFVDSLFVKNTVYTDRIASRNGNSITIEGLDLACQTLTDTQTVLGCGASNGTGVGNTSVGINAGNALNGGELNTLVGRNSGLSLTGGDRNTVLGENALMSATNANANVAVGNSSLDKLVDGTSNVAVGFASGSNLTDADSNTFVGKRSGFSISTGRNNTIIGNDAGRNASPTLRNNVLIGSNAGVNNTQDERLMIDISDTDTPLIDGDFLDRLVVINDSLSLKNIQINEKIAWDGGLASSESAVDTALLLPVEIVGVGTRYIRLFTI